MAAQILRLSCAVLARIVAYPVDGTLLSSSFQHLLIQIVHFHQSNSGGVVYAAHDRGVVTRLADLR